LSVFVLAGSIGTSEVRKTPVTKECMKKPLCCHFEKLPLALPPPKRENKLWK
jgi:hypothetical protein